MHLDDQWRNGIAGVLIGGSMGMMQLLDDQVYHDLVQYGVGMAQGHGEIMVGAGDASFTRTLHRIEFVEQFNVDGIVVLSPYFETFGQTDLIGYFTALADRSRKPLYLYDLPGVTRTKLELETVLQLSKHPNIRGIKCSGDLPSIWRLINSVGDAFRVIPAQPLIVDFLVRGGGARQFGWHLRPGAKPSRKDRNSGRTRRLCGGKPSDNCSWRRFWIWYARSIRCLPSFFDNLSSSRCADSHPSDSHAAAFGGTDRTVIGRTSPARFVITTRLIKPCSSVQRRRSFNKLAASGIVRQSGGL